MKAVRASAKSIYFNETARRYISSEAYSLSPQTEPEISQLQTCAIWFTDFFATNEEHILDNALFSDEEWFHLSGPVNCQNRSVLSA
jgi:hypothetical protein